MNGQGLSLAPESWFGHRGAGHSFSIDLQSPSAVELERGSCASEGSGTGSRSRIDQDWHFETGIRTQ